MRSEASVEIDQTEEKVFNHVANMEHLPEWSGIVTEVRQPVSGQLQESGRFTAINNLLGWRFEIPYEVTSFEPNRRLSYWSTGWLVPLGATFTFERVPQGMRLTQIQKVELSTFLSLFEPLLAAVVSRPLHKDLVTLKDLLEMRG